MLWIWLLLRNAHQWATGPLDRYFTFLCAHCAATIPAMVRTYGAASAANLPEAQRRAHMAADAHAHRVVAAAGCPACGQLQPAITDQLARAAKSAARRTMFRLPIAGVLALLAGVLLAIPAVADLRHSVALSIVAFCAAAAIGALTFAILSLPVPRPLMVPSGLWFSRDPSQGPSSWFPAQPGPMPIIASATPASRIAAFATAGVMAVAAVLALVGWRTTFRDVWVVSTEGTSGDLKVRIDGVDVGGVTAAGGGWQDAPAVSFEVRSGSSHRLVVVDADNRELTYDLDPSSARHGWVIAPHARERDLCLASITWYYGMKPKTGNDRLLNQTGAGDFVELHDRFDYMFVAAPATIEIKNGGETRSTLRAFDCAALERDELVPFKDRDPAETGSSATPM